MGNIFRDSFDVAGVDIVFEVCVFDAYSSLERMSCKWNVKIMTQNKKENNVGLLTEIYIRCGLAVSSRFWILWGQFCSDTVMHEILHLLRINSTNIMLLVFFCWTAFWLCITADGNTSIILQTISAVSQINKYSFFFFLSEEQLEEDKLHSNGGKVLSSELRNTHFGCSPSNIVSLNPSLFLIQQKV